MSKRALFMPNRIKAGRFVVEPPTLTCLGFEWYVEGDDNHNATVEVFYRKKGNRDWQKALPLLRIQNEESIFEFYNNSIDYITPNMMAAYYMGWFEADWCRRLGF